MNRVFRLIWSVARNCWVVASEKVSASGGIPARTAGMPYTKHGKDILPELVEAFQWNTDFGSTFRDINPESFF